MRTELKTFFDNLAHSEDGTESLEYVAVTVLSVVIVWVIYSYFRSGGYRQIVDMAETIVYMTSISFGY